MAMNNARKPIRHKRTEPSNTLRSVMKQIIRKLDARHAGDHGYYVLTERELEAAKEVLRAGIASVAARHRRGRRGSKSFCYKGTRYGLAYSLCGQLYIVSPKTGRAIIASAHFAI